MQRLLIVAAVIAIGSTALAATQDEILDAWHKVDFCRGRDPFDNMDSYMKCKATVDKERAFFAGLTDAERSSKAGVNVSESLAKYDAERKKILADAYKQLAEETAQGQKDDGIMAGAQQLAAKLEKIDPGSPELAAFHEKDAARNKAKHAQGEKAIDDARFPKAENRSVQSMKPAVMKLLKKAWPNNEVLRIALPEGWHTEVDPATGGETQSLMVLAAVKEKDGTCSVNRRFVTKDRHAGGKWTPVGLSNRWDVLFGMRCENVKK